MSRPAGTPNKPKRALLKLLQEQFPDYHPVVEMAKIAHDLDNDISLRSSMHKEVAQYVTPKLKAVEVSGNLDANIIYRPIIKRFDGSVDTEDA